MFRIMQFHMPRETPELIDVRLHLLPAGSKYRLPDGANDEDARRIPPPLLEFLEHVTKWNPIP